MRRLFLLSALCISVYSFGQLPEYEWVYVKGSRPATDLVESLEGNIYSVGRTSSNEPDCFIVKLDSDGNEIWEVRMGDAGFGTDGEAYGTSVVIDNDESVYVLGEFEGVVDFDSGDNDVDITSVGARDIFLVKYNSDGEFQWQSTFGSENTELPGGLAIDNDNNLILGGRYQGTIDFDPGVGEFFSTANELNAFLLKLDTDGEFVSFIDLEGENEDGSIFEVTDLATDSENSIVVCGRFSDIADFDPSPTNDAILEQIGSSADAFLLKLTSDFDFVWVKGFLSTSNVISVGVGVTPENEVVHVGRFSGDMDLDPGDGVLNFTGTSTGGIVDKYVVKLDETGEFEWASIIQTNNQGSITPTDITTDIFGDVYICGHFEETVDFDPSENVFPLFASTDDRELYIQKLSGQDGSLQFAISANNSSGFSGGVFVSEAGDIFNNGRFAGFSVDFDPGSGSSQTSSDGTSTGYVWKLSQCFPIFSEISVQSCDAYVSPSGGEEYVTSGTYTDTIPSTAGCDSIITIDLTILESTEATVEESACVSFTWDLAGTTYTESGNYETTIPNEAGCDSLITLELTINEVFDVTETETACESFIWEVNGATLIISDTYIESFLTTQGCDSIRTLDLTILEETSSAIDVFACDEFESPSGETTYTESGTYEDIILNTAGCDSTIAITLEIGASTTGEAIIETSCFSYTSPSGQEYTESGDYTEVFVNAVGCDSVVALDITINTVNASIIAIDNFLEAEEGEATYQWLDCNDDFAPIADANEQGFQPVENGSYAVEVSNAFCTDTSDCEIIVDLSVVSNGFDQKIGLYPNPSEGEVFLSLEQPINDAELRIYTITGELVQSYRGVLNTTTALPFKEDLRGTFIIEIIAEGKKAVLRATRF